MSDRYEIRDILSQDTGGVVFLAKDKESGDQVVIRRFFPFGRDGGGLGTDERGEYDAAIGKLASVEHPALRKILGGGIDPHDGIPFLVTEWIEGQPLADLLAQSPLTTDSARAVLDQAIATSRELSTALGEEAVWIETDPRTIVIGGGTDGREVTFWLCPMRWLGDARERASLQPLLDLAEHLTGWKGKMLQDRSGDGLGGWIRHLRQDPARWDLATARTELHRRPETSAPAPAGMTSTATASFALPRKPKRSFMPGIVIGTLILTIAGLLFWRFGTSAGSPPSPVAITPDPQVETAPKPPAPDPPVAVTREEPVDSPPALTEPEPVPAPPPPVVETEPPSDPAREAFEEKARRMAEEAANRETFSAGESYTFEGEIIDTDASDSGDTVYALLRTEAGKDHWIGFWKRNGALYDKNSISSLLGKHVKATGKLRNERIGRGQVFHVESSEDFTLVD